MTIWIGYTTLYREGGAKFSRVARTLARTLASENPDAKVIVESVIGLCTGESAGVT